MQVIRERQEEVLPLPPADVVEKVLSETGGATTGISMPGHQRVLVGTGEDLGRRLVAEANNFYASQRLYKGLFAAASIAFLWARDLGLPEEERALQEYRWSLYKDQHCSSISEIGHPSSWEAKAHLEVVFGEMPWDWYEKYIEPVLRKIAELAPETYKRVYNERLRVRVNGVRFLFSLDESKKKYPTHKWQVGLDTGEGQ